MKLTEISFRPRANVEFSPEEVSVLMKCSHHHYDGRCQDASLHGGFLYGISNSLNAGKADAVLDWDEIDTLAKIVEVGQYLKDAEEQKLAFFLNLQLRKTLHALNDSSPPVVIPEPV
jgi:hypothetical protein